MHTLRLGGAQAKTPLRSETLRDGALSVESPRGLNAASTFLIEALPGTSPGRCLFGMDSQGAVALAACAIWPAADVHWTHLDSYLAERARAAFARNDCSRVTSSAAADLPAGPFDLVALPFPAAGESQLMWDLLEAAHDALRMGGRLVAATDGKPDAVRAAVKKVFRNVTPAAHGRRKGAAFFAERRRENAALSDRAHIVRAVVHHADDDGSTRLDIETRPGTFAYRRFDAGTRALAESWRPDGESSVLDLGAGCGALGLYAALRLPTARVTLVDSNARAIECARGNIERAGVAERVDAVVRADLEDLPCAPGSVDVVLANPPYFSDFRIARSFVDTARASLRPGGRAHFVARTGSAGDAHARVVGDVFGAADVATHGAYDVVTGVR